MTAGDESEDFELTTAPDAILAYLDEQDGPVENLRLLAVAVWNEELEAREACPEELPLADVSDRVRSRWLPDLDREGAIDYDRTSETVVLADGARADERNADDGPEQSATSHD